MPEVAGQGHHYPRGGLESLSGIFTQRHLFGSFASSSLAAVAPAQRGKHVSNEFIFLVRGYQNI